MITQALLDFAVSVFSALLSVVPSFELPSWFETVLPWWATVFDLAEGFRVWIPFDAIKNVLVFSLAVYATVIGIRVARIMVSLFTGGGGSAA